ncbi:MAG: hypothetical protein JKY84_06475, partial [Emcibacteraceae bacterium]|nr:hypothetical protein [Emcibacteraceae bacterium]
MDYLNNIKISTKLPIFVLLLLIFACSMVGVSAYLNADKTITEADKNRLTATVEAKHFELSNYINSIQEDIRLIASNPNSLVALNMFNIGFNEFGSNALQKLQQEYIIDSPRGIGFK